MGLHPTPQTKTYSKPTLTRNVPIRKRDKNRRPPSLQSGLLNAQSFEAFLCYYPTHSKTEHEPQGGEQLLKRRCDESKKRSLLLSPHLFSQSLTAQALFALKIRRIKTQTAIPCECLLGEGVLCTQAVKRSLVQGVLITGMCLFEDEPRAATAARKASVEARCFVRECVAFCCEAATQSKWHNK